MNSHVQQERIKKLKQDKQTFVLLTLFMVVSSVIAAGIVMAFWVAIPASLPFADRLERLMGKAAILIFILLGECIMLFDLLKEWLRVLLNRKAINRQIKELEAQLLAQKALEAISQMGER